MGKDDYSVTITFPPDLVDSLGALQQSYRKQGIELSFNKLVVAVIRQASNAGLLAPVVSVAPEYDPRKEELYTAAIHEICSVASDGKTQITKLRRANELWVAKIGDREADRPGDASVLDAEPVLSAIKEYLDAVNGLRRLHNRPILTPTELMGALINHTRQSKVA